MMFRSFRALVDRQSGYSKGAHFADVTALCLGPEKVERRTLFVQRSLQKKVLYNDVLHSRDPN